MNTSTRDIVAAHNARVFNERYPYGAAVLHITSPGSMPVMDRVYGRASVLAGRSVVYLAGQDDPVDTNCLYRVPEDFALPEHRRGLWPVAAAFALGVVVTVGFAVWPVHATAPSHIVIDCDAPGSDMPAQAGKGRVLA